MQGSTCLQAGTCRQAINPWLPPCILLTILRHLLPPPARPPCSLRRWKADFKTTVEAQRGRKFEADTAKMYGMF